MQPGVGPVRSIDISYFRCLAEVSIFLLFLGDRYCYSVIDTPLGRYLSSVGHSQGELSTSYAVYGFARLLVSLSVLLLLSLRRLGVVTIERQFNLVWGAAGAAYLSSLLVIAHPSSYAALLCTRILQGSFSAVYFIFAVSLVVRCFPMVRHTRAISILTAGMVVGDSLAPVAGGALYDLGGILLVYLSSVPMLLLALGPLSALGAMQSHLAQHLRVHLGDAVDDVLEVAFPPYEDGEEAEPWKWRLLKYPDYSPEGVVGYEVELEQLARRASEGNGQLGDAVCTVGVGGRGDLLPPATGRDQALALWRLARDPFITFESISVFLAQLLRAAVDVMLPLAMATTPTWLVGIVCSGAVVGAMANLLLLNWVMARWARLNTRVMLTVFCVLMSSAVGMLLLWNRSVATTFFLMVAFGAGQGGLETLANSHVARYTCQGGQASPSESAASMCLYSLYYTLGFTVGAYVAMVPEKGNLGQQRLTAAGISGLFVAYNLCHSLLLAFGVIPRSLHLSTASFSSEDKEAEGQRLVPGLARTMTGVPVSCGVTESSSGTRA